MSPSNEDPRYDAEVEAARAAAQRPDSAEADRTGADEESGLEPQAAAAKSDTPGMDSVREANAAGADPDANFDPTA